MEEEEYEEVVEYYIEETIIEEGEPEEVITEITETISTEVTGPQTTTYTIEHGKPTIERGKPTIEREKSTTEHKKPSVEDAAPPVRKRTVRTKVDPSKFLTPYLQHSNKMKDLFSENKYKEKFRKEKGKPYASTIDTPEMRRIKKVQDQLSEVKYRMAGEAARTVCHVDEKAKDIEHAKKVSQQVSKVLYKQNWEESKDKYLLPPDAPEFVNAIKNTAMFSKKLYTEDWEGDKTLFYPYNDSPELRRVAQAQKSLSDIVYKKGHDERKSKFTPLPDPPDVEQAKKVTRQLSDIIYHKDYKNNIKGKWSQTPCYDVAIAKMNADNISMRKYQEDFENIKDQIYFMQTETPEYEANKRVSDNVSKVKYRADYEKNKAIADYNVLPATENPLLRQLKAAGNVLSDKLYKEAYEQSKGTSMNYCDTPKFQTDTVLKNFSDVKYKDAYQKNILGHYLGSFEDPHHTHCMKVEAMKSDKNYKADYEEEKTQCYFPQTITQEYEAIKKLEQCKDHTYKKHPDQTKFTQVTDSPVQKQAEINSKQLSDIRYKSKGEEIIHKYHLPPDVPQFIQARVNAYNISDNYYKTGLEELKSRGYDLKSDAIPIRAAKAARQAASDVNYKKAYELAKGKLVGFKSLQDDPKLVHYMKVAKLQSEREYKKDYEKTKTRNNIPLDMVNVVGAKKAQEIASNTNYKNLLHHYTYLPDAMNVELTKNMMEIQSDNAYKADYNNWMKGIGWIPIGSLEVEKAKKAGDALNEKKYRQHPDTIKFTSVVDSPVMVQAKQNSVQLNEKLYKSSGEEVKHKYTLPPDVPQFLQARYNAANVSDAYYKQGYHDLIAKGNNVSLDAIPITRAKASRNIASDYKYKEAYEKAKGKQVGFRSLQDDPKLVHYMNVGKIQSEREYKKDYEKTKTNYHTPADTYSIQAAKQAQDVASNAHYKNLIHHYTYLPDAMDVELAKNMMQIQSDNAYKEEYNSWFKGIGWSPLGSLDVEKAKKAGDALNEKKYRQHPDTIKFTSIPDSIPMVLAQHNTKQLSDVTYKQEGEKVKHKYTLDPDVPQFIQARVNAFNLSDANYKADWKKTIAKGYDLKPDAIPIIAAKASRNIASDYKYKESYEKDKGKQVGYRSLQDDPKLVHYMNVAKLQSDREYRKDYEVTKTKYHTPLDMFSVTAAKKAQEAVTNAGYKQLIHDYTLLPDSVNLELSRNVMQIQSDNVYKADFNNWLRGVGWIPIQSLDVEKAKKATEILSEKKYRQHPDKLKYSITMDAMEQVLAKQNAKTMNKRLYTDKWNKEKTSIHVMPDTPEILQSRVNQITMSNKLYKAGWEEDKKKGYDMQPDAIPIKAAKASRDIASDYKYKLAYEKAKGKHIGFRSLEDDPKLVHFMQVAKMQSDREYKKDYEKAKTNFHTPVDMVSVVAAKKAQEVATNANYKNLIHTYNVLPDAMSLELAKNMMQIQSDNQYRAEYDESMKGIGWMPLGSLEAEKNKKAMEIVSEKKYRQHPDKLKFSVPMDSMNMVLALNNAKIMDEHKYKQAWEEDKKKVHIMPDIPQIALAKANAFNLSDKMYRLSFEESRRKGYDLRADAIPIKAAKASRDIASDYKYKLGYEQDKGKLVGFRSLQDDPKLVHYMQVAKMQSDREYKKAYEMSKTHYQTPSDTLSIVAAKEAQDRVTNTNYKRLIHQYMLLPDAMSLELYRNMNQIQSDNEYKQDYNEWFKGIGWSPAGSLDVEKSKKATEIASDRKYRQHPSMFPFTKQNDAMDMVLAKQNANIMNKHAYTQAWEKDKTQVHVMPDTPDILQAKQNKTNYSQKLYKLGWEEMIKKGYDLTPEAISVKAAKASRDIASDYKYKEGYRKQQGHHIGFRSLQDDPKMLWSMQVAKMQSEREYKKDFEKWKTKFNMPVDMLGFLLAKKCQELVSDIDYKRILHRWTCLPDQVDVTQAKRVYELQSDNLYKSDLQWLKGLGWSPLGSLESEKNKKASEILSEKKYRQHPDTIKFTSIPDAMDVILAKSNAKNRSDILYREAWDKDKTQVHIMPDTPEILLAKSNLINTSDKHYKLGYEELKRKGYDLPPDAIPLKSAKASRDIASEYQYKTAYRKQLGHHIGARNIEDDPKMMWSMHVAKIQSDREYKKAFEKTKTHFSSPVDMLGIVLAKKCQELVSDIDYRHYLHQWICLPDQNDVIHAKKAYDLQSDNVYKSDLLWLRGIGWSPSGSLDDEKNKRASLILSDKKYRQHPDTIKFTSLPDSMPMVLAKHNSEIMNQRSYVSAWEKDKTSVHIMPDTPGILLAQQNKLNFSEKLYKLAMEEEKKKGYDMRADAIPIKAAKASRDIASDYKYKEGYRKQLGHHIGARNIEDDPKMMWSMHVAKIQSDREYKKAFEKTKTHFSSPVDMLGIVLAKKCQELVSDIDYRHYLHGWTCLPDQNDVIHARKAYDLQSDNCYKSDLEWLRGVGWVPIGSLDVEKAKKAGEILSDKVYRQPPDTIRFTSVPDSLQMVLAKQNAETMNKRLYTEAWDKDKTQIHIMPDTPEITLAKQNMQNYSVKLYKQAMEEAKKKGYDLRSDAIPIQAAKASRQIASDYKYKEGYRKQLGHHIGARNIEDDPKMMWSMHVAKIQSDREYKKAFEKTKTHFSSPVDMLGIVLAKKCQELVSDIDYRHYLADAIPIKQAKASRDIASEYKYKETHEKQKGHYIGCRSAQEDPKLAWAARAMVLQNDRIYRKAYHDSKAQVHIPVDAMSVQAAKECQTLVSDVDYRHYLHQWTCLPDQNDVIHARKAYDLQSDAVYKSDLEWLRGIGWLPNDSPDVKRVKHAQELLSDNVYRTPIESLKYTSVTDSPDVVLAKVNAEQVSIPKYKEAWEKDKIMIHITPDTPEINLAKSNAVNYSQKMYKDAWDELKTSYDLRADAIPIKAAKASREIASDYKYKLEHEKQKGHYVGVPNAKADTKMNFALGIGKVQSELEYKKHFAKWKTQCHLPVDMLSVLAAKHGQSLVSDVDYRHYLHQWICLPDQNDVIQARKAYDLQSDAIYKSDLEWLRGIGWLPNDSVGINHVKHAGDLLNERKYRTKAETLPFTPVADRVDYITVKNSGEILSDIKYHKAWNEIKSNYTLTDTPQLDMAREAARILNQNLYKESWEKEKATGYLLPPDTVQICHAKRSNDVQSELKYKAEYVKQRGHYVGVASMRDDPKLVWFEHAGEIQNDRLYKSDYHKTKSKIHIPPDMVSVVAAKECQTLVSDVDYRQHLHEWTCHPDQNDCIQARKAYDLQSDNIYKSDLEWLRGCGWIPLDSVEHKKVKNAQELINKRAYTKEALDNFSNYTSVVDTPDIVLAKINSVNQSDLKYKETFNLEKGIFIGSDDTPALNHAKDMSLLYSDKLYKKAWEVSKPIGYTLDEKYIPVVRAKRANYINSELKYKEIYEKLKGHYLAGKDIGDFPSVVHSLAFQKIRSALAYRKNYEDTKANVHIPSDMMNHVLAKKCQYILSDLEYRIYLHQWNCSPEENDVIQARKAQEILSDVVYKDDLNWLKGIGCYVWDTPQILHAKKSYDLQSQIKYTAAGKENLQNFGVVTDTPLYVTAVQSGINASDVKYKEEYHKIKDQYTTVTETVDSERVQNLKHLFSNNIYKKAWEKVKATGYIMPSDAVSLARAKELKHNASIVKYREEYDKFKALYTLPRGVEDDPNTARCLRVGKLNIDRLYREVYEKNKAKIHIIPDMVDIISAKDAQKKITEIDYRTHLHEWICLPDLQMNAHVRKVTDQVSDVIYKDDLNWLKGIGCFVWDTPEILHAKHAYDLRSDIKYKSKAEQMKSNYTVVMDTPVYVQNVLSGLNSSEAVYRGEYIHNVKGKVIPTDKTVDLERAYHANKIQSENLYRWAGVNALPTGYSLPTDTPGFQHAKHVQYIGSDLKYKEAYEHMKAKGYTLGPKDVTFENVKKVNQAINERLYRATYHKYKDKIHTTPDTPEIRQVRATQEAVSDLIYKSDLFKMQGHLISLPYTPQVLHCRYVGDITSDNKYKEDLKWLRGLGCFLYDTPDMVRARHLRKLWSNYIYTDTAKKMWPKYNVVLDTPGYRAVQELKTHLSELVYRAAGKELKTKYTSILDTPDFLRAKQGQKIQSQYLYVELATKERPHHHAGGQTPAFTHARHVKDMVSEKKYKTQYEKMKDKYTPVPDTPVLIRAKRAYLNASDLRYKETFENTKGKYHTVKDALDIVYHRKVTDDISSVKYKENYMSQLGIWRSIPDRPEHFHHRAVTDAVSDVKYKEDLSWLKGTGCYVWDTPSFVLAEKNKVLYSGCKYKEIFEKTKSHFKYVADSPINKHFKYATQLVDGKLYKAAYEKLKDKYSVIVDDPRNLLAKWGTVLSSQVEYKKEYEKKKDKYTTIVDTPEHLRTTKVNKQISDIIYKLEYNKAKPRGYTTIHDTPMLLHVRKVKDRISDLKYKEVYERNKSHCNVIADSVHIKTPRHAYKLNSNLDYKKKYEAAKAHWHWIADRPDFIQAAKSSLQQSDYEYKLDREFLKGCKLSVTDDKNTVLALNNAILASDIKYKEKHNKARGTYHVVPDTPQILLAKNVSSLVSENKYKEHSKKQLPHGSYTTLPETRDTAHVKEVTKNVSETNYKKKFVKEKGKSNYSIMLEPPEVKHAMEVAKKQSTIEYKKDAKSKLHYTPIADRPDIKKATQAAKLISDIEYKKRGEAGIGVTMLGRPDIELAKEVSKLTSQVKYKENFSKEMGKKPKYDLKEAKIYKTMKDAHNMASEVKYKADLKKLHKPVTDMSESLIMNHVLSTSQLASAYQYKKQYEKSKGHYHVVPDNLEQVHLREASELQSHVKYREKYEKEKGKPMLDFETPTYLTAKESQLMQSEKEYKKDFEESIKGRNLTGLEITPSLLHVKYATKIASEKEYRKDLEEGVKGKGLTALEETPDMLRAKNATQILNEKAYKKALDLEIRGRGLTELALETPDFVRAKNATDIASQIKYKQLAEMEKANYTSVVDTPEIIHAQQVKNLSSQKKYKEDAERTMPYYVPVADTPEMQRVRENQKNFSTLQYQWDLQNSKGKVTVVQDTPEMLRVKENQKNFSSILYKEDIGTGTTIEKTPEMQRVKQTQDAISSIKYKESIGKGTPIPDLPEVKRVKETQKHISSVLYKEDLGTGIPTPVTPEIERVKRNQEHISSVLYKEGLGTGIPTPVTPEMERVKRNQENISSVLYKEGLGIGTPVPVTPEMERVKRNQENFSSVLYKEDLGTGTPTPVTPEIERVKRSQEHISSVLYKEDLGTGTPTPVTPEIERVKRNQEHISSVLYKEDLGTGTPTPVTPEVERAKRNQEHISSVLYKESVGTGTPTPITPEMERVKRNQEICSSVLYKENIGKATPTPVTPEMERVKRNQEIISSVLYKENVGKVTPTPITPEMERVKRNQEIISSVLYKENLGRATPTPITPEMERVKRNQEHISSVLYKEHLAKGTPTPMTPEMERAKRNQENISSVLYSDSFRKQVQGKAAYVLDTPEMRRVRETQKHISTVKYHEDFEKSKGSFTPVVTDPITERVKKNTQDFSDISYRGIQRRVVEMERKRVDQDQETITGLRVWRTNAGSVFDYDPAEDNIQSRSLHMISVQAQRRSREHSRSASALSLSGGEERSEPSDGVEQHLSYYSNGGCFTATATVGYKHAKTIELPQQRSSSVATQQTTVSSVPSHPSTAGKTYQAMYDYTAADADEVSFKDGDTIVNVQAIDEGWMFGTVQRTGKTGMLPANYVEAV
ncbi:nebulin [Athene cunicularia]|uniref:nebulin n=1 Tax=Athene cunicularia TaxID=194338 RepID=UPI000EF6AC81|nr:nebulin [Athene cunicularia]